ncbi:hypothetical protein CP061683_1178A, partial [Chlamydia psittaci 06-1683]
MLDHKIFVSHYTHSLIDHISVAVRYFLHQQR